MFITGMCIEFREDLRIHPQVARITPNDGVSPDRVVAHALALDEENATSGGCAEKQAG